MFKQLKQFPVASPQSGVARAMGMEPEMVESFMGSRRSNQSIPRSVEDIASDSIRLTIGSMKAKIGTDLFYGIRGEVMKNYKTENQDVSSYKIEQMFDDEAMYNIIGELLHETKG